MTLSVLLHDRVTERAHRSASGRAVILGDESLTYEDLETTANRLAHLLVSLGVQRGDRVALVAPKHPLTVASMLACLKVGALYVPVDTATPAARIALILRSAEPRALVTTAATASLVDGLAGEGAIDATVPVISLDEAFRTERSGTSASAADWTTMPGNHVGVPVDSDHGVHILFTSGSTGIPKGVVLTHANITPFVDWAVDYFGIRDDERLSGHTPFHFDLSTLDIHGTFAAGAELHLVPPTEALIPQKLARFIRDRALTQWFSVPSVLSYLAKFDAVEHNDFPSLRRVIWCGEVLPVPSLIHWMTRLPDVQFTNLYGPTETTIASSYHTVASCPASETEVTPIGVACGGEELAVLTDDGADAPDGEIGELYIGGVGLSPGYWRDEQKTSAVFVDDRRPGRDSNRLYRTGDLAYRDSEGIVHFVGRADTQIKTRGYRVELGEIEVALAALDSLRESAVVAIPSDGFEGMVICGALVLDNASTDMADVAAVRVALQQRLPTYMIPSKWLLFDELPRNSNGKVDRPHLRDLFSRD